MKKAGRLVSYLLVLALVTSLFSGLRYVTSEAVSIKAEGNTLNVLEIVPASNMATFGYMVKSWTDDNFATKFSSVSSSKVGAFKQYLVDAGLGTFGTSSFESNDYFKTQVLGLEATDPLTISVTTITPGSSNFTSLVNSADFIIINQTVPEDLQIGDQKKFTDSGCTFTNAQVLTIFKKIAGVEGKTPVPYIIDYSLMSSITLVDSRGNNAAVGSGWLGNKPFAYLQADTLFNTSENGGFSQAIGVGQGAAQTVDAGNGLWNGSDAPSYKLYKLLSAIDPATLYGLYFRETDGSYGINRYLDQLVCGPDKKSDGQGSIYAAGTKLTVWCEDYFRPYFLTTYGSSRNINTIMSKMGWFEASGSSDFLNVIGGSDGRGIVYNSSNGLFFAAEAVTGSSGGGLDLSSYTDIGSKVSISYSGGQYNGDTTITNNTNEALSNWYVKFTVDGFNSYRKDNPYNINCNVSGNTVTLYSNSVTIPASGTNPGTVTLTGAMDPADSSAIHIVTESGSSSGTKLGTVINSFRTLGSAKNDYHTYRILMVSDNVPDSYANRTVIAEIVKAANDAGKGLAGGVYVECMSKPEFDNISVNLNQTYDMICTVGSLSSTSIGYSKLGSYTGKKLTLSAGNASSITQIVDAFKNNIFGQKIGVDFEIVPNEYYTDFLAFFSGENGFGVYHGTGNAEVDGDRNYINDSEHRGKRTLDFKFKVTGASSFSATLYVDVDGDFKFEDDESVSLSSSNNTLNSIPLSHSNLFGEGGSDYVGGFAWKIVISGGSSTVSRTGYSAIKNETSEKQKIKILQIYPTDYQGTYNQDNGPHPLLILPTKTEIAAAGDISAYNINDTSSSSGIPGIYVHFKDAIKIDKATGFDDSTGVASGISNDKVTLSGGRESIIANAGFLYYFLNELQDYDIDVTRYSVNGFNTAVANKQIQLDTDTGRLAKSGGTQVKNLNGSLRYGYTAAQLYAIGDIASAGDAWKTETVSWTEGTLSKYLVVDGTELIYGKRGTADGSVTYYGATLSSGTAGEGIYSVDKDSEFDILMIGFGSTLDYMAPKAVSLLKEYLSGNGPAFVGNGAVSTHAYNKFGNDDEIRSLIGISKNYQSSYSYVHNAVLPIIKTNDTIFSHYPYTINEVMKATGDGIPPYELKLTGSSDDPIVAFAKYRYNSSGTGEGSWGNALTNYYVYKKNNIVYCGYGATFNPATGGQLGNYLPMAETLMIVNALVASSRFGSSPIHSDPYIDCVDDDASVIDVTGLEDDYILEGGDGEPIYSFKDSVYTDYDAYDIAAFYADSSKTTFNKPVQNSGLKIPGVSTTDTNIRWIPYQASLPTSSGGYIEFKTTNNTNVLNLKVYSVAAGTWVTPESGKYHVTQNGLYYIGVPLDGNNSAYSSVTSVKLGFLLDKDTPANSVDMFAIRMNLYKADGSSLLERHTISMIRRVLYHAK